MHSGISRNNTFRTADHLGITDPSDGNIDAESFAVATDIAKNRCCIAYKTQVDDEISFAEIEFINGSWGLPTKIDVYPETMPGENFALTYDPNDPKKRALFFTEEDGDGYIRMQHSEHQNDPDQHKPIWSKPRKLKGIRGRDDGPKAHRFSKFAATHYIDIEAHKKIILVYYVDESNGLQEIVGELHSDGNYRWTRTSLLEQDVVSNGHLAVTQKGNKTYVLFRNSDRELCLASGTRKDSVGKEGLKASWKITTIREKHMISKNSPLAIASHANDQKRLTAFYLQRQGKAQTIYALDLHGSDISHAITFKAQRVGKLEPSSNLGAASLSKYDEASGFFKYDARLFSVSKLDGDNVLLERIRNEGDSAFYGEWVISGGVVTTDVDHLLKGSLGTH